MSSEPVKRQILLSIGSLRIPLERTPTTRKVSEACSSAKLLRNRLLREHGRVTERIEALRQQQLFNEDTDDECDASSPNLSYPKMKDGSKIGRDEFVFIAEMAITEELVIPLLLAHAMNFSTTLLPQLLKFLAAMMLPVPRFSSNVTKQQDLLTKIKNRCGTDEFFALLVQCIAPIAKKRTEGSLQYDDVVLLEVVLTLIKRLLEGNSKDVEHFVGAFCRNSGVELLLVVINQNFSTMEKRSLPDKTERSASVDEVLSDGGDAKGGTSVSEVLVKKEDPMEEALATSIVLSESDEGNEDDVDDDDSAPEDSQVQALEQQFAERTLELLESEEQIWRWNSLVMPAVAQVLQCVPSSELAHLTLVSQSGTLLPEGVLGALRGGKQLRECKREMDNWRYIAKSRNGATSSNSLLLCGGSNTGTSEIHGGRRTVGTVSTLFGTRRKDPLDVMKDMDLRKRGRFIKGMFQDSTSRCDLPLPTKMHVSQQCQSFLCFGFEPLNSMTWQRLQKAVGAVERASAEYKEVVAGYKSSGETLEMQSPIEPATYEALAGVLHYMSICASLLRYVREVARRVKDSKVPHTETLFQQHWQRISTLLTLDHLHYAFVLLRTCLQCRELRRRTDMVVVVGYLAELLLLLNLLLEGDMVKDVSVGVAAHALASSTLYKEENIACLFGLLTEYATRSLSLTQSQVCILFVSAVFQLMEKCSCQGNIVLPKRAPRRRDTVDKEAQGDSDEDSVSTIGSVQNEALLAGMTDMIHDDSSAEETASVPPQLGSSEAQCNEVQREPSNSINPDVEVVEREELSHASGLFPHGGETEEGPSGVNWRPATLEGRAVSVASTVATAATGETTTSGISSEREVAVSSYMCRLASPKNMGLLYAALSHWRVNEADVNLGLTYLMERLVKDGYEAAFFHISFLLLMRDVLMYGKETHGPLYRVCDRIVFGFFNPPVAIMLDKRSSSWLKEESLGMLSGAQSYVGFEVSLRCARSLFSFTPTDYSILEEKIFSHNMDYNVIDLPDDTGAVLEHDAAHVTATAMESTEVQRGDTETATPAVTEGSPPTKRRRRGEAVPVT